MRWEYFHKGNNVLTGELFTKLTTFMTEIFKIIGKNLFIFWYTYEKTFGIDEKPKKKEEKKTNENIFKILEMPDDEEEPEDKKIG